MKIGIDARMISATGIGRYTKNLIDNLAQIDHRNSYIIFLNKNDVGKIKLPQNFKKVVANFHWYGLAEQTIFLRLIKKHGVDLMHFPHFNVPYFYRGKFVVTIHDLTLNRHKNIKASTKNMFIYQVKHFFYEVIIKNAVKKAITILVPSRFTKKDIENILKVGDEKIIVTQEGGPSEELLSLSEDNSISDKINKNDSFLLYVGNAYPHKNLDILTEVASYLDKNIKFVLAGKDDYFYKKLKEKVALKKLNDRILFLGFVTDSQLVWLYKRAQAYIFPSLNEGFGLPLLEAAAFSLPIVCSNNSSLPEVMGDAALYFDPKSKKDISEKIKAIISSDNLRAELKEKEIERIKLFSWKKMAIETLKSYNDAYYERH